MIQGVVNWFNELPYKIGFALGRMLGELTKWAVNAYNWVVIEVPKIPDKIAQFFRELPDKIAAAFNSVINKIKNWATNAIETIKTEVPKITSSILNFFKELPSQMAETGKKFNKWLVGRNSKPLELAERQNQRFRQRYH